MALPMIPFPQQRAVEPITPSWGGFAHGLGDIASGISQGMQENREFGLKQQQEKRLADAQAIENQLKGFTIQKEEAQAPFYEQMAKLQNEVAKENLKKMAFLREHGFVSPQDQATIEAHQAEAEYHKQQAEQLRIKNEETKKLVAQQQRMGEEPLKVDTIYGVPKPQITSEDILNKQRGFDTFTPKIQNFYQNTQAQLKAITSSVDAGDLEIKNLDKQLNLVKQARDLTQKTLETGSLGAPVGYFNFMKSGNRLALDKVQAEMAQFGVANLKAAMGGGSQWNQLEFGTALQTKPNPYWGEKEYNHYEDEISGLLQRAREVQKIREQLRNNPKLGLDDSDMNAIIRNYQRQYPVYHKEGKSIGKINWKNLGDDKWQQFFSPEAIAAVKKGEDFVPKNEDSGTVKVVWDKKTRKLRVSS